MSHNREMLVHAHLKKLFASFPQITEKEFLFLTYCNTNGQQVNDNSVRASSHQAKVNAKFLQV